MQFLLHKRGELHAAPIRPQFDQVADDKIIGSSQWLAADDHYQERYMVFTVRSGKIIDMQGFASRREAERFAHRP